MNSSESLQRVSTLTHSEDELQASEQVVLNSNPTAISAMNVPNALSSARLILACVVFALTEFSLFGAALVCFLVAAGTDWIDGWYARKYQQVTKLGRILDPFVDKVIIIGTMTELCARPNAGLAPWMVIVVAGRELLVTSLRGMVEGAAGTFQRSSWASGRCCCNVLRLLPSF